MFHVAAFGGNKTDSTANENVPAVADACLTTSGNSRYLAPANMQVFGAYIANDTITRARITAPSLRNEGLPEIYPVTPTNIPSANPVIAFWGPNGPAIRVNEEFGIECSNGASTIDKAHALLFLRDNFKGIPGGKRMTVFGTSAQTLLVDGWTLGGITLDQTLPVGHYGVIGMAVVCTACYGARLVFPRGNTLRPGTVVAATVGGFVVDDLFRAGKQGLWGEFDQVAQPQLELIGTTAGAQTANVYLDLVKMSDNLSY